MWVWSDELATRFPADGFSEQDASPLVAYAVEQEADLEALAREVLRASQRLEDSRRPESGTPSIPKR
jgi:hypothetical protein